MSAAIKISRARYRGDPGIFGTILGGIKTVAGVASNLPGPIGTAAGAVQRVLPGGRKTNGAPAPMPTNRNLAGNPLLNFIQRTGGNLAAGRKPFAPQGTGQGGTVGIGTGDIQIGPFGQGVPQQGVNGRIGGPADGTIVQRDDILVAGCPTGYHPNKASYYETSPTGGVIYHPPGTKCVRNRRRNPGNMRALDRSISRIQSADRLKKKLSRVTVRKKCD